MTPQAPRRTVSFTSLSEMSETVDCFTSPSLSSTLVSTEVVKFGPTDPFTTTVIVFIRSVVRLVQPHPPLLLKVKPIRLKLYSNSVYSLLQIVLL